MTSENPKRPDDTIPRDENGRPRLIRYSLFQAFGLPPGVTIGPGIVPKGERCRKIELEDISIEDSHPGERTRKPE